MRIPIREQLALLILLSALISLTVVSVATWITNHTFVLGQRSERLTLTASLKAAQLSSNLNIMQTSANFGNNTAANWVRAQSDMAAAISGGGSLGQSLLLQTQVFPRDGSGPEGPWSLLNVTSTDFNNTLELPLTETDGSQVHLGSSDLGYPPELYPNLTYLGNSSGSYQAGYNGRILSIDKPDLLLGPWVVDDTLSLVSLTMPVINNTSAADVLGWLTVLMDARLISQVLSSTDGLGETGQTLLLGPANTTNTLPRTSGGAGGGTAKPDSEVHYVLPLLSADQERHPNHVYGTANAAFSASQYPAISTAIEKNSTGGQSSGSLLSTRNENGDTVSVGYAVPQIDFVDWLILVEQAKSEVWQPIRHLRNVIIGCVFATAGFLALLAFPLAHFAVMPIRRLREATRKSVEPPNSHPSRSSFDSFGSYAEHDGGDDHDDGGDLAATSTAVARKEGWNPVTKWTEKRRLDREARREARRRKQFRIPGKVKERKVIVKDELTDLTSTFNEMSDELMMQYERLEERVQQRTAELELSKKAAEVANESKTLFIANISHELKTPLNGILGMCAVCMQEDDPQRLKRSLGIIYKSGDLLLNLLTDLLTFSKNQVGQHLSLDEKEFRLRDISSQVLAIFDKQAKEGQIDLRVEFQGIPHAEELAQGQANEWSEWGPPGTGRIKDMILYGDTHRILQVVINLVSNSLKFTPPGGKVTLRIRCLPELPEMGSRKSSFQSKQSRVSSKQHSKQHSTRSGGRGSGGAASLARPDNGTQLHKDRPFAMSHERNASPPPGKCLSFEFEVEDTGPGIAEDEQQRIFAPFYQSSLGLNKKYGGTGLGLSICTQLAGLMRGSVVVHSTVGVGSTFTMKIPLRHLQSRADSTASSSIELHPDRSAQSFATGADNDPLSHTPARHSRHLDDQLGLPSPNLNTASGAATSTLTNDPQPRLVGLSQPFFAASQPLESPSTQPAAMEKITAEAARGGRIRVLVAEDNKTNQEVVLRMLKLEDIYDVTVAKDGQEALDKVKDSMLPTSQPFNLIFMDVQMPNVDGLQSTRLIREIGYQAPIVALTAFSEESNIKDCMDSGMNYFLSKPIRRPQLKKELKEYCAPIPEEEGEDVTPPGAVNSVNVGANTTIVMVNGGLAPEARPVSAGKANGKAKAPAVGTSPRRSGEAERAVSPHSQ
ncbi:Histidine kinase osmosensor [Oleoguttula sp. CCFEE 5521]